MADAAGNSIIDFAGLCWMLSLRPMGKHRRALGDAFFSFFFFFFLSLFFVLDASVCLSSLFLPMRTHSAVREHILQ